jgi:hypothetical protein
MPACFTILSWYTIRNRVGHGKKYLGWRVAIQMSQEDVISLFDYWFCRADSMVLLFGSRLTSVNGMVFKGQDRPMRRIQLYLPYPIY